MATVASHFNAFPNGLGGVVIVPYTVDAFVDQTFNTMVAGKSFSFTSPATFEFKMLASGNGEILNLNPLSFEYDLTFDPSSDITGFGILNSSFGPLAPPGSIAGSRSRFVGPTPIDLMMVSQQPGAGNADPVVTWSSTGNMRIEYDYTPNPQPVPEPASWSLLVAGLGCLLWRGATRLRRSDSPLYR